MKNKGGSTDYYAVPIGAATLQDLIEHKGMNFAKGNIFKAIYRSEDDLNHSSYERDLNKIIWFAQRELNRIRGDRKLISFTTLLGVKIFPYSKTIYIPKVVEAFELHKDIFNLQKVNEEADKYDLRTILAPTYTEEGFVFEFSPDWCLKYV